MAITTTTAAVLNTHPPIITGEIKTEVIEVTPALARQLLKANSHNRPITPSRVTLYARDMAAGRWRLTHQGIAIANNGSVLDGQHRLSAVIEADQPIPMLVTTGLAMETQQAIDGGASRSARDVATLRDGVRVNLLEIAIARMLQMQLQPWRPTRQEIVDRFDEHRDKIMQAVSYFPAKAKFIRTAIVGTVITRALYTEPSDEVARFMSLLCGGFIESPQSRDGTPVALRKYLTGAGQQGQRGLRPQAADQYLKTEKALRNFLDGVYVIAVRAADRELFLLPGEVLSRRGGLHSNHTK